MASQTRPEPMNASPHHSKVKVAISLSDTHFVAGNHVTGKIDLECRADKILGIGVIVAELFAIQELNSRDHSARSTFLHITRQFQGPTLPPSNAVHPYPLPGSEPLPADYYPARKGMTTFFFQFPLPESSPCSIDFGKGLAKLRYVVKASVGVIWKGDRQLVTDTKDVDVVEADDEFGSESGEHITIGEYGKVWAQGRIVNRVVVSGQSACVELHVKNNSSKKTTSLSLVLTRHLHLPSVSQSTNLPKALQISDTLVTVPFKGPEYIVHPGTEGVANLVFDVPKNVRGVRGGLRDGGDEGDYGRGRERNSNYMESLFEVRCFICIKIGMGIGSKDIVLNLPITVVHPAALHLPSLQDPYTPSLPSLQFPHGDDSPHRIQSPQPYFSPHEGLHSPPQPSLSMQDVVSASPTHSPYLYSISPPQSGPSLDQPRSLWSPPFGYISPPVVHALHNIPQLPYYFPPQPTTHQTPLRSASADPYTSQQLPSLPSRLGSPESGFEAATGPHIPDSPDSSVGHPPAIGLGLTDSDGELAKGERASRISAHLRRSSRHRSVSPQSRRFPLHMQTDVPALVAAIDTQQLSTTSVYSHTHLSASPRSVRSKGEVISPRPMLSPKNSFTVDPVTKLETIGKSESVEQLERIAAGETREVLRDVAVDKTLPRIPELATSSPGSAAILDSRLPAEELPSPTEDGGTPKLPSQPRLAPLKSPRSGYGLMQSGLDALEQKLLEQVGTRKPEQQRKPDVRSILPILIPSFDQDIRDSLPTNESNISSLVLADKPSDDGPYFSEQGHETALGQPMALTDVQKRSSPEEIQTLQESDEEIAKEQKKKQSEAKQLRKAATGRVAAWLGGIENGDSPTAASSLLEPASSVAKLQDVPYSKPVKLDISNTTIEQSATSDIPDRIGSRIEGPEAPQRSSGFILHATLKNDPVFAEAVKAAVTAESEGVGSSAEVTSFNDNGQTPKRPIDKNNRPSPGLPVFPPPNSGPGVAKYDIRSARGGRGGKVTSVTAVWASLAQQDVNNAQAQKAPTPAVKKASLVSAGYFMPFNALSVEPASSSEPAAWKRELAGRQLKMIKSTSVPAALSSSLAAPMISSTASLARPSPIVGATKVSLRPVQESSSQSSGVSNPRVKGEMMFGQNRLRDLIKKYQQS